jgi:HD-like signal output (HDOD) protein
VAPAASTGGSGLDALLEEASNLPLGNPETFLRVASLCRDPRADARAVATEIQRDDGFAAAVLRLANSAYFASSSRIGDLPTAVARLGLGTVESLAISIPGARLMGDNRCDRPCARHLNISA